MKNALEKLCYISSDHQGEFTNISINLSIEVQYLCLMSRRIDRVTDGTASCPRLMNITLPTARMFSNETWPEYTRGKE